MVCASGSLIIALVNRVIFLEQRLIAHVVAVGYKPDGSALVLVLGVAVLAVPLLDRAHGLAQGVDAHEHQRRDDHVADVVGVVLDGDGLDGRVGAHCASSGWSGMNLSLYPV